MKVYAFDVDETLYLSHGPVQWEALVALRAEGHVLGLCGNWAAVTLQVPEWHCVLSFIGLRAYASLDDRRAADAAGWRFISEGALAAGGR
jgi:hypothetical protein